MSGIGPIGNPPPTPPTPPIRGTGGPSGPRGVDPPPGAGDDDWQDKVRMAVLAQIRRMLDVPQGQWLDIIASGEPGVT